MTSLLLPDVTLVVIDTAYHKHTEHAVRRTLEHVSFGDILAFSDRDLDVPAETHRVALANRSEAERFMYDGVAPYLRTPYALYVQWDSWVVNPGLWRDEYLHYDYIGGRWNWLKEQTVGCGGFSLRSKKLLDALVENKTDFPFKLPEDATICQDHRPALEARHGLRWGPEELAMLFCNAVDFNAPLGFGFHGVWFFVEALDEAECLRLFQEMTPAQLYPEAKRIALYLARMQQKTSIVKFLTK